MSATVTCVYHVGQGGESLSALAAQIAAVPPPLDILTAWGVRVVSDSSSPGSGEVIRTIEFGLNPVSAASAVAALNSNNEVAAVTVSSVGSGYVVPPVVGFTGGSPYKNAKARAYLKAVSTSHVAGSGYTSAPTVTVVGALNPSDPNARAAKVTVTVSGGHITGAAIVDAGQGYIGVPIVVLTGGGGNGGSVSLSMGVGEILLDFIGQGFEAVPTVVLTPRFQALWPPSGDQAAPFRELMSAAIAQAVMTTVSAEAPVVA